MYLYREQADALLRELVSDYDDCIAGSRDLLLDLLTEDDWSFIIKSHAFLEAAVTEAIIHQLDDPRLLRVVERLPLSNDEYGKLSVAKDLDIVPKEQRACIKRLSELRNYIVHRPENINFQFEHFINGLDKAQKRRWQETIAWFQDSTGEWKKMALTKPKLVVWMSSFLIYTMLGVKKVELAYDRKLDSEERKTTQALWDRFLDKMQEDV